MKRREFLKATGLATATSVVNASISTVSRGAAPGKRPNILIIMTDQQFADAMSWRIGDRFIKTPNMDSLAEKGMLFTRAYCANPLCVPCRTSMFTGRYPHETGVQTNGKVKLDAKAFPMMGTIFRDAGYDTGYIGKWHVPFSKDVSGSGFSYIKNLKANGGDERRPEDIIEFLEQKRDKPFLLVASFNNPHNICEWARGQKLPDGDVGEPPPAGQCPPLRPGNKPPRNETDIIAYMRQSYQSSRTFPVGDFDDDKWRQYIWAYYRMIEKVDAQIGKVLNALRELGLEQNTLVVFTSDHGDCQGAHRWNQKTVFYDEASRVPFILKCPGKAEVGTSDKLVHTGVDLIPTLCEYAGIGVPAELKGRSVRAIAGGSDPTDWREYLVASNHLVQGAPVDGVSRKPQGRMVRSDRYKYCLYNEGQQRESLVDMENDPSEMTNQARNPRFKDVLEQHRRRLKEFAETTGDRLALKMLDDASA